MKKQSWLFVTVVLGIGCQLFSDGLCLGQAGKESRYPRHFAHSRLGSRPIPRPPA